MNKILDEIVHIETPQNPYWEVFKRFGRDELIALVINVSGTAALDVMFDNKMIEAIAGPVSRRLRDFSMSTVGPVIEKAGFFPGHFHEGWKEYKKAPEKERKALKEYAKNAIKGGTKSLIQDVLVHDPLYVALMYGGLTIYPETPAAILATSSFLAAVGVVAVGEVTYNELQFKKHKRKLKNLGFEQEKYYESRFLIDKKMCPNDFINRMQDEFELGNIVVSEYHDRYLMIIYLILMGEFLN